MPVTLVRISRLDNGWMDVVLKAECYFAPLEVELIGERQQLADCGRAMGVGCDES